MIFEISKIFLYISQLNANTYVKIILIGIVEGMFNIFRNLFPVFNRNRLTSKYPEILKKLLYIPKRKNFAQNIDDKKVIFITGGSKGIGKEVVRRLAELNYRVHIFARTFRDIHQLTKPFKKNQIRFTFLDLSDLGKIGPVISEVCKIYDSDLGNWSLEYIICNSGVYYNKTIFKKDVEMNLLVNHFGHHVFVQNLIYKHPKRVLFTSSSALYSVSNWCYENDTELLYKENDRIMTKYAMSKLANALYALHCKNKYRNIQFIAAHPGIIATELFGQTFYGQFIKILKLPFYLSLYSEEEGADSILCALFFKDLTEDPEKLDFFVRGKKALIPAYINLKNADLLMKYTDSYTK